jgi:hypothetical protein
MIESGRYRRHKNLYRGRKLVEHESVSGQERAKRAFQRSKKGANDLYKGFQKYQEDLRKAAPGLDPYSDRFIYKEKKKR